MDSDWSFRSSLRGESELLGEDRSLFTAYNSDNPVGPDISEYDEFSGEGPSRNSLGISSARNTFHPTDENASRRSTLVDLPEEPLRPPIRFVVVGHPLAGKTTFAKALATLTDARVMDVAYEVKRRFPGVKRDFLWKKRLKFALEASHIVNRENGLRWQKNEYTRRRDMHAWVENHIKEIAEAELIAALERDRDAMHKLRVQLRMQSEHHAMGEPYGGMAICQLDDQKTHFNWRKFAREILQGRKTFSHQELLELAWDLFQSRRLRYKRKKKLKVIKSKLGSEYSTEMSEPTDPSETGDYDSSIPELESEAQESSEADETDYDYETEDTTDRGTVDTIEISGVEAEDIMEPFLFESFEVDPDDPEVEESIRMRFPMIPFELVDIVPSPPLVNDLDPVVNMIVEEKLVKESAYADTNPPEIFVEIMKRAIADIEEAWRKRCKYGLGGWIVDNFPSDIEKWRIFLKTPQIKPDHAFLLLDITEGTRVVWNRFKRLFRMLHPKRVAGAEEEMRGEDEVTEGLEIEETFKTDKKFGFDGEDPGEDGDVLGQEPAVRRLSPLHSPRGSAKDDRSQKSGKSGGAEKNKRISDLLDGEVELGEIDTESLAIVSKSHFMLSLFPQDELSGECTMSASEEAFIDMDLHRVQTSKFSGYETTEECKESIPEEIPCDPANDPDWDTRRRRALVPFLKPVYSEMLICIVETEPTADPNDLTTKKWFILMPPETAESEEGEFSDDRLGFTDDEITTPSEMGSFSSISSVQSGYTDSEREAMYDKLKTTKIDSPKKKFFTQVKTFNVFWNAALPLCHEMNVKVWDVGLCDERNATDVAIMIWAEVERWFDVTDRKKSLRESVMMRGEDESALGEQSEDDEDIGDDVDDDMTRKTRFS